MKSEDIEFLGVMLVVLTAMSFIAYFVLHNENVTACLEAKMQWVDGNCVEGEK